MMKTRRELIMNQHYTGKGGNSEYKLKIKIRRMIKITVMYIKPRTNSRNREKHKASFEDTILIFCMLLKGRKMVLLAVNFN